MAGIDIVPFADEHLDLAAGLLAERHARHRAVEPLLPDIADFRGQIQGEWHTDGASGVIALQGDEAAGFLIGQRREDPVGPYIWSYIAGHAVRTPELTRDLYRVTSERWVDDGLTRHFVYVPKLDDLIDPWFRLSFGASAALATRETASEPAIDTGVEVRPGVPGDIEVGASLDRLLGTHLLDPPSFGGLPVPPLQEYVDDWRDTWGDEQYEHFVAERDGRVVGQIVLYRRPPDLRVPSDSIDLASAATEVEARGSGAMVALTAHVLTWAHEHGYPTMITDWRMTNLEASRFWPRRGFREVFLRMYRSIP
jgi:GNAT superfamily N-acetyltransferase